MYLDSQLVTSQIQGTFTIKEERMLKYVKAFKRMKAHFLEVQQILREEDERDDELARLASALT